MAKLYKIILITVGVLSMIDPVYAQTNNRCEPAGSRRMVELGEVIRIDVCSDCSVRGMFPPKLICYWIQIGFITPTPTPTTAILTGTPTSTPTAELSPDSMSAIDTATPTATPTPFSAQLVVEREVIATNLVTDFEVWGTWSQGDEAWGVFNPTTDEYYSGQYAGKLIYDFPSVENNYVIFRRVIDISGRPDALRAQVYGDGSTHFLNIWVQDSQNQLWQFTFGRINHTGWQTMIAPLDVNADRPNQLISGVNGASINYPVRFVALMLDGYSSDQSFYGEILIDDLVGITFADSPNASALTTQSSTSSNNTPSNDNTLSQVTATVLAANLNVRSGPGATFPSIGTAKKGQSLPVVDRDAATGWVQVTLPTGNNGWVSGKYVQLTEGQRTSTPFENSATLPEPSPSTSTLPITWLPIPAGDFVMGSNEEDISATVTECNLSEGNCRAEWFIAEQPQKVIYVAGFEISKYEITNNQYNACVDAGSCNQAGRAISDNRIAYDPAFFDPEKPVVSVSYFDAAAYCAWIGGRLPSEEEWEKAARSTDGRRYPWGNIFQNGVVNLASTGPATVGSYPAGVSLYGVHDMAGNVFEWTSTTASDKYILKGGSWNTYAFRGRSADRGTRLTPDFANYDIGFRCAK